MEKIWITGAKGHVGTALSALLDCREYEIFPTDVDEVDVFLERVLFFLIFLSAS